MRRVLLGALLGSFALQAQAVTDETVYDYLVDRSDATREDIKQDEADLIAEMSEEKTSVSRDELTGLKEEMAAKELEVAFAQYLQTSVRGKLSSRTDWEKRLDAETLTSFETKVKELDLAKIELKKGDSKVLEEKTFAVDKDSPFQVVQELRVMKKGDGDHKIVVGYRIKLDEGVPRNTWPSAIKRKFEKMDNAAITKFMEDELSKGLEEDNFEVGKAEELQKDETKRIATFKGLAKDVSSHASVKVFGAARTASMNTVLAARIEKLGSRNKDLSEIWKINEQISRESDERGRKEKLEDLRAKLDIAKALRNNPKLAASKDPCEVIIGVIGKDRFQKLSTASQMDCESHIKKEEVAKEESQKEGEADIKAQAEQSQQALQYHNQLLALAQSCMARAQQMGKTNDTNSPQITLVRSLYNALLARGAGCTYFGAMMGDVVKDSLSDDAFSATLFGANPFLMDSGVEDGQYNEKAKEVVKRQTPPASSGVEKLLKQRECLAKMESLAGMSLQSLSMFSSNGGLPPEALQDSNVRQMMKFQEASKALIGAIDEELMLRNQTGAGGLKAMSANASQGQPLSLGGMGGRGTPVRIRETGNTQTERGLSGNGTNNRMDSGTRTRGSGTQPPPNF